VQLVADLVSDGEFTFDLLSFVSRAFRERIVDIARSDRSFSAEIKFVVFMAVAEYLKREL
jgi:hypothetical protein